MKFTIPLPLQHEHEALPEELRLATQADGEEVMYPAAVLLGQVVRQRLSTCEPATA